jgi:hypothetical protein
MNLLCPNCQKRLTVPEQFAGQLMKCPLCAGTFNVPGLPAPAAPPPQPSPVTQAAPAPAAAPETYGLQPEAPPSVAPATPVAESPPSPAPLAAAPSPAVDGPPVPQPAPAPSIGYTRAWRITFEPTVLQWIPAASVVLIFILQLFFPWVGVYPGGVPAAWQGPWGAAFGAEPAHEKDLDRLFQIGSTEETNPNSDNELLVIPRPGVNLLMIFYLLPFFLLTLVVTVGVLVVSLGQVKLPPSLDKLLQLRWTLVAGLNVVTFLFLALQLILGFSLENTYKERVSEELARREKARKEAKGEKEAKAESRPKLYLEAVEMRKLEELRRTFWLKLAVFLHLLAIVAALVMAWIEKRTNRPPPRLVLEA